MIAVTGAAGFVGSNLAHRLASQGYNLVLVDRTLSPQKAENLIGLPPHPFLWHDVFLAELNSGALAPDAIFHLGACSRTTETSWEFLEANNVGYSQSLWNWCTQNRRPFYYASSAATYGDGSRGFDDQTHPDDLLPLNLYGRSKNDFDRWALAQKETPPQWGGLKFFNVYGPREAHKERMASVVWQTFRQISETGGMRLFRSNVPTIGDGEQSRDFVFVDDCVEQMLWMWRHAPANGIYNCGTARARTFFDLARAVFAALNLPANISFIDMPADISRQYQNFTQADMHAIRVAGYDRPATQLEDGVVQTIEALRGRAAAA
jgi:ADP-L-glycero-D-manno-heptose 6-epimerase